MTKNMKIAFFLDIPYGLGGAGNLLLQQAVLMSKLYDVIVIIPSNHEGNYNVEYAKRCERYQIRYVSLQYNTAYNFSLINFIEGMKSVKCIEEFAIKECVDFFHSVQLNIAVEYVSRKLRIPHLMNIYQLREEEFIFCPGNIYSHYHLCDSILYSERWSQKLNIESRCVRPMGLLEVIKKKDTYNRKKIKILMLGDVCPRKNQMTAIKAIESIVSLHNIELHIAGNVNNNYGEQCKQYIEDQNLKRSVIFHGFISEIRPLLDENDCLLCTSTDESFPSSIVEALSYDLTIISTPVAGVPELFIDRNNSFISKDFSCQSIQESILMCLKYYESGQIRDIHINAEKIWINNFDRNVVRKKIDDFYRFIMNKKEFQSLYHFSEIENSLKTIELSLSDLDNYEEKWIHKRSLYYIIVRKCLYNKTIYIWGAGMRGKLTYEILKKICPDAQVVAFIDTYKEGTYLGYPIVKIENVHFTENDFFCVSFAVGKNDAIQYLEKQGLKINQQIWCMP